MAVCIFAAPTHAAVVADFNGDGVPDRVTAPTAAETSLLVRVSGLEAQVLSIADRILAVVAVDIDHDGDLDLSTFSARKGVSVWFNRGGHGKFVRARRAHRARGLAIEQPRSSAAPRDEDRQGPAAQITSGDSKPLGEPTVVRSVRGPDADGSELAVHGGPSPVEFARSSASRAPPVNPPT